MDQGQTESSEFDNVLLRDLYASVGPRNCQPLLNLCPKRVGDEMNISLEVELTMEEVKAATFQLGANKAPGPDGLNRILYRHH